MNIDLTGRIALVTGADAASAKPLRSDWLAPARPWPSTTSIQMRANMLLMNFTQRRCVSRRRLQQHAVQAMIDGVLDKWGRLDILVNNAGVEPHASLLTLDEWDWRRTIDVNLTGPFLCSQSAARVMKDTGGGVIVNIASIAGRAAGLRDRSAYVASKTAWSD